MPTPFPELDPETGQLTTVDYYSVGEVAELFHQSHSTVRRRIKSGEWPYFEPVHGTYYLSPVHVAEVVRKLTHDAAEPCPEVDDDAAGDGPPRLGIPLSDTDLEGVR
jgi:hypothetical protein